MNWCPRTRAHANLNIRRGPWSAAACCRLWAAAICKAQASLRTPRRPSGALLRKKNAASGETPAPPGRPMSPPSGARCYSFIRSGPVLLVFQQVTAAAGHGFGLVS